MRSLTDNRVRQQGFGLIEVLVVIMIMFFMSLAIFNVMASSEGNKRTTTTLSDANQAGSYSTYVLDKAIRNAGAGIREDRFEAYGCPISAAKGGTQLLPVVNPAVSLPPQFLQVNTDLGGIYRIAPVLIDKNASPVTGRTSDVIITMSGNSGMMEFATALTLPPTVVGANYVMNLQSTVGFRPSDLLLITQPTLGSNCLIEEVDPTYVTTNWGTTKTLNLAGNYYSPGPPGVSMALSGLAQAGQTDHVLDLGNESADGGPSFLMFTVANGPTGNADQSTLYFADLLQLAAASPLTPAQGTVAQSVADGVYELHAIYGIAAVGCTPSAAAPCPITAWVDPGSAGWTLASLTNGTATAASAMYQIKAIRIGLILRTDLPEKTAVTTGNLTLFNDMSPAYATPYSRALLPAEQFYRYRTFEATIPVRNNIFP